MKLSSVVHECFCADDVLESCRRRLISDVQQVLSYLWNILSRRSVFPKQALCWKHAVLIFIPDILFLLIALITNTRAFLWTNPQSEVSLSDHYTEEIQMMPPLLAVHSEAPFDLWTRCVNRSKNCTLFIFLITDLFFLMMTKQFHKTIETLRLVMQICKITLFDKLWIIRSISCFFFLCYSFVICYLTVWACACLCVSVCACVVLWREGTGRETKGQRMLVWERLCIYVAIYLNKVHFLNMLWFECSL